MLDEMMNPIQRRRLMPRPPPYPNPQAHRAQPRHMLRHNREPIRKSCCLPLIDHCVFGGKTCRSPVSKSIVTRRKGGDQNGTLDRCLGNTAKINPSWESTNLG